MFEVSVSQTKHRSQSRKDLDFASARIQLKLPDIAMMVYDRVVLRVIERGKESESGLPRSIVSL